MSHGGIGAYVYNQVKLTVKCALGIEMFGLGIKLGIKMCGLGI